MNTTFKSIFYGYSLLINSGVFEEYRMYRLEGLQN